MKDKKYGIEKNIIDEYKQNRAVASGGGQRGQLLPPDLLSQTNQVVFFWLSYFDYSDLQLFAILYSRSVFGDISYDKCWK